MTEKKETAAKETAKTAAVTAAPAKSTGTVVWCGPTVRGVARQFTPFTGGVPQRVEEFIKKYPAAAGLCVPLKDFAKVRANIVAGKGVESALVRRISQLVKEG